MLLNPLIFLSSKNMENNTPERINIKCLKIKKLSSLDKNFFNKEYYLDICINNKIFAKTAYIKPDIFHDEYEINYNIPFYEQLESIYFKFCNANNPLSVLYQGIFNTLPSDMDILGTFNYDCDIRSPNKDKINIIFSYTNNTLIQTEKKKELEQEDTFETYTKYVKKFKKMKNDIDNKIKRVSANKSDVSLIDLATGDNARNFNTFVKNIDYIKALMNVIIDIIFWKDPYKTIAMLSILSVYILYTNFFILFLSLLMLILIHLSYRDTFIENFSLKDVPCDVASNLQVIMWIVEITNTLFAGLEVIIDKLQNNSKELFKEVYINLLKLILWNIPFYFILTYGGTIIDFRYVKVIILWLVVLYQYPPFKAFIMILFKLLSGVLGELKQFSFGGGVEIRQFISKRNLNSMADVAIPFFCLFNEIRNTSANTVMKNLINAPKIVIIQDKSNYNLLTQMFKYELYEKQRWKIMGWTSNLDENDGASWIKKGNSKNMYFDKGMAELPDEEHEWKNNWEIELTPNNDKEGWEYSTTFDSDNWKNDGSNSFVRRRKWIRYAKKKSGFI